MGPSSEPFRFGAPLTRSRFGSSLSCVRKKPDEGGVRMAEFDTVIRNGVVVTAADVVEADLGIAGGVVTAVGRGLGPARREIDAAGRYVMPGGIDTHCHFDQPMRDSVTLADDFLSGTVSAAHGGTTTVVPFACQLQGRVAAGRGRRLPPARRGQAGDRLRLPPDHLRPDRAVLREELPALIARGLHLVQDLHDLRDAQAERPADHRRCSRWRGARAPW